MKKLIPCILILVIILLVGCSKGTTEEGLSWEDWQLKGEVKTVTETISQINEEGTISDIDSSLPVTIVTEFDSNGLLVSSISYNAEGLEVNSIEWEYFSNKNEMRIIQTNDPLYGFLITIIKYSDAGLPIETTYYNKDGQLIRFEVEYDENGFKKRSIFYNEADQIMNIYESTYDCEGILISQIARDEINDHTDNRTFEYDGNGNVVSEIDTNENGYVSLGYLREYDEHNSMISETMIYGSIQVYVNKYEYIYDEYENWVKQIYYREDGNKEVRVRSIDYY